MAVILSPTEDQIQTALRSFILAVVASGVEVVEYNDNRVPEPTAPDFVVMTPMLRARLETNTSLAVDGGTTGTSTNTSIQPTKVTVQLDIHGPNSADYAQTIATLIRDPIGVALFVTSGFDVTPLYAEDPRQVPFVNGEGQYEKRWTVDVVLQANQTVTSSFLPIGEKQFDDAGFDAEFQQYTGQQFADEVKITPSRVAG